MNKTAAEKRRLLEKLITEKSKQKNANKVLGLKQVEIQKGIKIPDVERERFSKWFEELDADSPFVAMIDGLPTSACTCNDRPVINFSSYNYLGLAHDARVIQASQSAIGKYGTSVSASRIASGERIIHQDLESKLAELSGTEDALLFVSGYGTNETVISHLLGKGDVIIFDQLIHRSVMQGAISSGATLIEMPHNDMDYLEQLLRSRRNHYNQCLIVVEGLYSMDGDLCDLPRLVEIKKKFSAALMVDEAHSLGVLGNSGRGVKEHFGVEAKDVDIWMGTLSKSLAGCGGFIAASFELITYLKFTAPGFVFSVGMSPANVASVDTAIDVMLREPHRLQKLHENAEKFLNLAIGNRLETNLKKAYAVVPIFIRSAEKTVKLASLLMDAGIYVQPAIPPGVQPGEERLRFFIMSEHTEEQLEYTIEMIVKLSKSYDEAIND